MKALGPYLKKIKVLRNVPPAPMTQRPLPMTAKEALKTTLNVTEKETVVDKKLTALSGPSTAVVKTKKVEEKEGAKRDKKVEDKKGMKKHGMGPTPPKASVARPLVPAGK